MENTADIPLQVNHNPVDSKPAQIRTISEVFEPNSAEYAAWKNVNQEKAPFNEHIKAIENAILDLTIYEMGKDNFGATGGIVFQNGKLYAVTAEHAIHEHVQNPDMKVMAIIDSKPVYFGDTTQWKRTKPHPNDEGDLGIAYLEITGEALVTIQQMITENALKPLAFTHERPHAGDSVAYFRKDQPVGKQLYYAAIETATNIEPVSGGESTPLNGTYNFTIKDPQGTIMFCSGMSGTPFLRLDSSGNPTNEIYGLASYLTHNSGEDALGKATWEGSSCDRKIYVRSAEGGRLIDSEGIPLGQYEMRPPQPVESATVRVTSAVPTK